MSQLLTLSRAAQILGVSRGALQQKIRAGELESFDGMITVEELLRVFPGIDLEETGAFERVALIKDQAFGRRMRERMLPSAEVLAERLYQQSEELAELRRHLAQYHDLIEAMRARLDEMVGAAPSDQIAALARMIDDGLAQVLGSEPSGEEAVEALDATLRVMSAHVRMRPSGREFFVHGAETVLAAALRAGLMPSYGCGNGNCGLCKARIVEGRVRPVQHSDYPLSAAEKAQNYALLCSCTAVSDLVIETIEATGPTDIPEQQISARVKELRRLGNDTMLLHVQTPRSARLRFFAGQMVTLGIAGGVGDFTGVYAIASCPCDDRNLLFHIGRDARDPFATRLFAGALNVGDTVNVRGPSGEFVLDKDSTRPLLFVGQDLAFAPIHSLIEHALAVEASGRLALLWLAERPDGHYAANQCRAWAAALDDFRYLPVGDRAACEQALATLAPHTDWDAYIAGDHDFVASVSARLDALGQPADRRRTQVL